MSATLEFPSHSPNHFITTAGDIIFIGFLDNLLLIFLITSNCCMKVNDNSKIRGKKRLSYF